MDSASVAEFAIIKQPHQRIFNQLKASSSSRRPGQSWAATGRTAGTGDGTWILVLDRGVTDNEGQDGKGHAVTKFTPDGKVLMTLGKPGVAGNGTDTFNRPSGVVVAADGDIFVSDGKGGDSNARIVKFSRDGEFIQSWGKKGSAPGEFGELHGIAMDSRGWLFVADRGNNRIEIFDQEGKFLDQWTQFSRPTAIVIDKDDTIYVPDNQSTSASHPGWPQGIYIGNAKDGKVTGFIPIPDPDLHQERGTENVVVDAKGALYVAGQKEIHRLARFVDGAVQVHPVSAYLH